MSVRTAKFNGVKYTVDMTPINGCCSPPKPKDREPTLRICCPLNTRVGLITAIHEAMHACNYDKHEAIVDRASIDIGRFLWRLGYQISLRGEKK
ncbi:hypothetical protein LCGC14_2096920 [marine sediment metagenome]|uniref:Uncharacterized protein n=1 Tax=marine sediment metagenome TaxID=412755 RepID=A0A0F9H7N7_9ZZZZ